MTRPRTRRGSSASGPACAERRDNGPVTDRERIPRRLVARLAPALVALCLALAGCGTTHPGAIGTSELAEAADVPLLPRLLGRDELRRSSARRGRRPARLHRLGRRQRLLRRLRPRQAHRRRQLPAAAAGDDGHLRASLKRLARHPAQHGHPRRPGGDLRRRSLDRALHRARGHRRASPTRSPTRSPPRWRCARSTRPALGLRRAPGARLLPWPVRLRPTHRCARSWPASPARPASTPAQQLAYVNSITR